MADGSSTAVFIADSPALDFLNTIYTPADAAVETIDNGEAYLAWLAAAGLVPAEIQKSFLKDAGPGELDAVAAQARALREWFRAFVQKYRGKSLASGALAELEPLNRILARDEEYGQIAVRDPHVHDHGHEHEHDLDRSALTFQRVRRWRSPDALLLPVARAIAELITADDFTYVKSCEGVTCSLLFVDRSRSHGRRWCDMSICGNRSKQQALRDRARGGESAGRKTRA